MSTLAVALVVAHALTDAGVQYADRGIGGCEMRCQLMTMPPTTKLEHHAGGLAVRVPKNNPPDLVVSGGHAGPGLIRAVAIEDVRAMAEAAKRWDADSRKQHYELRRSRQPTDGRRGRDETR